MTSGCSKLQRRTVSSRSCESGTGQSVRQKPVSSVTQRARAGVAPPRPRRAAGARRAEAAGRGSATRRRAWAPLLGRLLVKCRGHRRERISVAPRCCARAEITISRGPGQTASLNSTRTPSLHQQCVRHLAHLLLEVRVVESAERVPAVRRVPDRHLALDGRPPVPCRAPCEARPAPTPRRTRRWSRRSQRPACCAWRSSPAVVTPHVNALVPLLDRASPWLAGILYEKLTSEAQGACDQADARRGSARRKGMTRDAQADVPSGCACGARDGWAGGGRRAWKRRRASSR